MLTAEVIAFYGVLHSARHCLDCLATLWRGVIDIRIESCINYASTSEMFIRAILRLEKSILTGFSFFIDLFRQLCCSLLQLFSNRSSVSALDMEIASMTVVLVRLRLRGQTISCPRLAFYLKSAATHFFHAWVLKS